MITRVLRFSGLSLVLGAATIALVGAGPLLSAPLDPPTWEARVGAKIPTPVQATAVRGRLPGFQEPDVVYVLAFVNFQEVNSRAAIAPLDQVQTEHGKKVSVVVITDEGPDAAKKFVESAEWGPRIGFVVAADPSRSAFRAFFGPQRAPTLPLAFVVRNGVVQWMGEPLDLAEPVAGCIRGSWDLAAARRMAEQRELWNRMMNDIEALSKDRRFDDALSKLQSACESALGDQQGQCLAARFELLVRAGRMPAALAVGEQILAAPMNAKQPAGLAWTIMSQAPGTEAARLFALRAAQASDTALKGRDAMIGAILARAQFMNGHVSQAAETARRALSFAQSPDLANALREDLRRYEGGAAPNKTPPGSGG